MFGGLAAGCIATQVALAELTHPPAFGVDLSGGPLVQWSPQPFYYLDNVYFPSGGPGSTLTIVSLLAVVGVVIGLRKRDRTLIYLAAFWIVPALVISLFLPAKNIRYAFITLPYSKLAQNLLTREDVFHEVVDNQIVVAGNDAHKFAEVFHVETRRPMLQGVLNAREPHGIHVIRRIITRLVGKASFEGRKLFYSVPAASDAARSLAARREASR